MAEELDKLLEKSGLVDKEGVDDSDEKTNNRGKKKKPSEPTVEVYCPKCKNNIEQPLSKFFLVSDTQVSMMCPTCGLSMLNKDESAKVIEELKRFGMFEEKVAQKAKKKDEQEEITDFELLKRLINQSFDGLKISEQDKMEIIEWFSMYEGTVQDWFTPNIIQWVTAYIDFMLKQRSYAQKTVTKAVGRLNSKMQLEMAKRQREMAITGLFQQSAMFLNPQQQPGQPMINPMLPQPPQMGFTPGMQQILPPGMQPPGQQLGHQPQIQGVQGPAGIQQTGIQPQQQTPEVMI